MTAEAHYLDALEALDAENREEALKHARKAVKLDPEHADAWRVISDASLPRVLSFASTKNQFLSIVSRDGVIVLFIYQLIQVNLNLVINSTLQEEYKTTILDDLHK